MNRNLHLRSYEKCNGNNHKPVTPLTCIAIDDDRFSLSVLEKHCSKTPFISLKEVFDNPLEALNHLKNNQPDLVFLDINMPEISGISIARKLRGMSMVIFTTSHRDFAQEGFDLDAIDFLLKPIEFGRFYQAVVKAKEHKDFRDLKELVEGDHDYIIIKEDYQNVKINLSDILFIEALDNYVKIHTTKRTYMTLRNLKSMANYLESKKFIRVHKSFIVALNHIDYFSRDQIHINNSVIPIGRTFMKKFRKEIQY